jgi:hypothetical protein
MQVQLRSRLNAVSRITTETVWGIEQLVCVCVCVCVCGGPDCTHVSNNSACSNDLIHFNSIEVPDCSNKAYYRRALTEAP